MPFHSDERFIRLERQGGFWPNSASFVAKTGQNGHIRPHFSVFGHFGAMRRNGQSTLHYLYNVHDKNICVSLRYVVSATASRCPGRGWATVGRGGAARWLRTATDSRAQHATGRRSFCPRPAAEGGFNCQRATSGYRYIRILWQEWENRIGPGARIASQLLWPPPTCEFASFPECMHGNVRKSRRRGLVNT